MKRYRDYVFYVLLFAPFLLGAISANLMDREYQKFQECGEGTGVPCVTIMGHASGTPVMAFSYTNFSNNGPANASSTIKTLSGFLHAITVNAGSSDGSIIVYDDPTQAPYTPVDAPIIASTSSTTPIVYLYDVNFIHGLTVYASSTQPADITVSWK